MVLGGMHHANCARCFRLLLFWATRSPCDRSSHTRDHHAMGISRLSHCCGAISIEIWQMPQPWAADGSEHWRVHPTHWSGRLVSCCKPLRVGPAANDKMRRAGIQHCAECLCKACAACAACADDISSHFCSSVLRAFGTSWYVSRRIKQMRCEFAKNQ